MTQTRLSKTSATRSSYRRLIFTGPIDEYFDFRFGKLPYRSLRSSTRRWTRSGFQPVGDGQLSADAGPIPGSREYKH